MMPFYRRLLLLGVLLLGACSQYSTQEIPASTVSDKPIPTQWQIKGKLGIRSEVGNGSLSLNWQQDDDEYIIYTQAPLGQGAATLQGNSNRIVITQSNKTPVTSFAPRLLVQETFGWDLPINGLKYWVKGTASPDSPIIQEEYDELGNLISLQQSGWSLSFSRYQRVQDWALPNRIRATRDDLRLTLIIRDWVL